MTISAKVYRNVAAMVVVEFACSQVSNFFLAKPLYAEKPFVTLDSTVGTNPCAVSHTVLYTVTAVV